MLLYCQIVFLIYMNYGLDGLQHDNNCIPPDLHEWLFGNQLSLSIVKSHALVVAQLKNIDSLPDVDHYLNSVMKCRDDR